MQVDQKAMIVARSAHHGQTDKAGKDYFSGHLTRVASGLNPGNERAVGWLHDIIEDTPLTLRHLVALGFPDAVLDAVWALTRRDETYEAFIQRIAQMGGSALKVKLADVADHLADTSALTDSQIKKYEKAKAVLLAAAQ